MTEISEVLDHYAEHMAAKDIDAMLDLMADQPTVLWLPVGSFTGTTEIRSALEMLFTAFPDFARTRDSVLIAGNQAALEFTASGTFSGGPFDGYEPTGESGQVIGSEIITFDDDGKMMTINTYWDGMQMARELGLMPDEDSLLDRGLHGALNVMTRARRIIRL